jgi:diguanylate cyclase (GGDEF)-like protein/PAS domain S-box-containing protein
VLVNSYERNFYMVKLYPGIISIDYITLFFQIFNNMSDMVFLSKVEDSGDFTYVIINERAKEYLGLTSDYSGQQIKDVLPDERWKLIYEKYMEAIEVNGPITYTEKLKGLPLKNRHESDTVYWETTVTPVTNDEGKCTHVLSIVRDITERKMKEIELSFINTRLQTIWQSAAAAMYTFDRNLKFTGANKAFEELMGWTEEELLKNQSISIIPEHNKKDLYSIIDTLKQGNVVPSHEVQRITKNGNMIEALASYAPLYDRHGVWDGAVVIYKDITNKNKIYRELIESEKKYRIITENSSDLIKLTDKAGMIQYASPSHFHLLGYHQEEVCQKSISSFVVPEDIQLFNNLLKEINATKAAASVEFKSLKRDGCPIWFHTIGKPILNERDEVVSIVFVAREITERKKYEEKLKHLALHDYLTGLPNRIQFYERLKEEMNQLHEKSDSTLSIMLLDLDEFKTINDTMGHDIGDELLKGFATRVSGCLRPQDMLARLGGDEFVILLPQVTEDEVLSMATSIIEVLQEEWCFDTYRFKTTSSIGISFSSPVERNFKTLLKNADKALYQAKDAGRNNYKIYKESYIKGSRG